MLIWCISIYAVGWIAMAIILIWMEIKLPSGVDGGFLFAMCFTSWIGVIIFADVWIEGWWEDRKFIRDLRNGVYDDKEIDNDTE